MALQLFNAVHNNDLYLLQEVLMDNPDVDVNAAVMGSMTALHVAAEKGYSSCVKVLLSCGANVNLTDNSGYTALMNCSAAGWPLVVRALLRSKHFNSVNNVTNQGMSALHMACKLGSLGITSLLLKAGARPNVFTREGETPLSLAINHGSIDVAQLLLLGYVYCDPKTVLPTPGNPKPLTFSLRKQNYELAKFLLLAGYNPWPDILTFFRDHPERENLLTLAAGDDLLLSDRNSIVFLHQYAHNAFKLEHHCRLVIRKALSLNIWRKVEYLNLPQTMKEYICFKDHYQPPPFDTGYEVSSFFAEHSELY